MGDKWMKVGVTGYFVPSEKNKEGWVKGLPEQQFSMFSYDFVEAIVKSKGLPTLLPIVPKPFIAAQLDSIDALIFAGGEDIHPKFYGQEAHAVGDVSVERDIYELELLRQALERKIPLLLVCRGMQLLNVLQKGTLYKDIQSERMTQIEHLVESNRDQAVHDVYVKENHFVSYLIGNDVQVNSIHHQAIKCLGNDLEMIGTAHDDIVEIVTFKDRQDVIGVQWHPEMMYESDHANTLFRWLIMKAEEMNRNRKEVL